MQRKEGLEKKKEKKITKRFAILYRSYTHCFSGDVDSLKQFFCLSLVSTAMLASHLLQVYNS